MGLAEGHVFEITDTHEEEIFFIWERVVGIRPGVEYMNSNSVINSYPYNQIGLVVDSSLDIPPGPLLEFPIRGTDLTLLVLDCMDTNHVEYLLEFNVELLEKERRNHDFDVLVHSPLSAHPTGRGAAILGGSDELSLLVKNQRIDNDEPQPYQATIRGYVRTRFHGATERRARIEEPTAMRLTPSGWGLSTLPREQLGRHSLID